MTGQASGASPRRVLFIANGNGEDSVAAAIICKLPPNFRPFAFPMVGNGGAYGALCPIVGPRFVAPSEGWRHTAGSVTRDIRGGMLASIWPAITFLRHQREVYDRVVVIGDGVGPLLCWLAGLRIDIYLDVFKVGQAHRYNGIEKWLLKRAARKVYCRDDILAKSLKKAGIRAEGRGNVMMDAVPYGSYDMKACRERPLAVALLPGSRAWTAEALSLQVAALEMLPDELRPDVFLALAGGLDPVALAAETGLTYVPPGGGPADAGALKSDGLTIHLVRGAVGNLLEGSDLVLSQAGTATQQALGLGKPVITFNRAGNRPKRMADEQALMGEARILTPADPLAIAAAAARLLSDRDERVRLGAIGRERLGGPGTLDAVIADLAS